MSHFQDAFCDAAFFIHASECLLSDSTLGGGGGGKARDIFLLGQV